MGKRFVLSPFCFLILVSILSGCLQSGQVSGSSRGTLGVTSSSSSSTSSSSSAAKKILPPSDEVLDEVEAMSDDLKLSATSNKLSLADLQANSFASSITVNDVAGEIVLTSLHRDLKDALVAEFEEIGVLENIEQVTSSKFRFIFKPGTRISRYTSFLKTTLKLVASSKYNLSTEAMVRIEKEAEAKRNKELEEARKKANEAEIAAKLLANTKMVYRYYHKASKSFFFSLDWTRDRNDKAGDQLIEAFRAYGSDSAPPDTVPVYLHRNDTYNQIRLSLSSSLSGWTKKHVAFNVFTKSSNSHARYAVREFMRPLKNAKGTVIAYQFIYAVHANYPQPNASISDLIGDEWSLTSKTPVFWVPK